MIDRAQKKFLGVCHFCRRAGVGFTTVESVTWTLCEDHFLSAAGNGFLPRRFGETEALYPESAANLRAILAQVE